MPFPLGETPATVTSTVRAITRPFRFVGRKFMVIYHEPPSWAETASALMMLLHCYLLLRAPQAPDQYRSMDALTDMLPGYWWAFVSFCGGMIQLSGVVMKWRLFRALGAFGAILWLAVITNFVAKDLPGWPHMSFMIAWMIPNAFVIGRLVGDWKR